MSFAVRTEDNQSTHGFDIGELLLIDPRTGKTSTPQLGKKWYMVYVELSVLLDQAVASKINQSAIKYTLPNGSVVKFDGKANKAVLSFPDLELMQPLNTTIDDLSGVIKTSLKRLEIESDESDVMIVQLREGLSEALNH